MTNRSIHICESQGKDLLAELGATCGSGNNLDYNLIWMHEDFDQSDKKKKKIPFTIVSAKNVSFDEPTFFSP